MPRDIGGIRPSFKQKYNLTANSKPWQFADVFLPFQHKENDENLFSFKKLTDWTNAKAIMNGAGNRIYKDEWTPFTPKEIRQHFGLYVMHGLAPTPRVEYKFRPQRVDRVAGNNFCFQSFGPSAARRHKHFKAFLSAVDPMILVKWINLQCPHAWELGRAIAVNEMTIGFQGRHKDKRRITYKAEGDGFQADALADNGYTYQIFMRNNPAPTKYIKQGLSPLHSRTMALFDSLEYTHHQCGMDNLYNSCAFSCAAYNHPRSILCHGVAQKKGRGVPNCVLQNEVLNLKQQRFVRGTVKAAVLVGDPGCPNLIASSVYDTKPVNYLSMVSDKIEWVVKSKPVFNVKTNETEDLQFLQLNQINKYNNEMGGVDIADQLRGVYRIDCFVRDRKWWFSILF